MDHNKWHYKREQTKLIQRIQRIQQSSIEVKMSFHNFASEQMKENMDSNIVHAIHTRKQSCQKPTKTYNNQPFTQLHLQTQSHQIKKHAYILDSDSEQSPQKTNIKQPQSHRSIDEVSQIIGSLSKQPSIPTSPKNSSSVPLLKCQTHQQGVFSYNFCIQCSQYLMCSSCVKHTHGSHMILTFGNQQETKTMTKQFLIEKIQETLQRLKSKQNDIKNKSTEMELIVSNVKRMEEEVMNKLESVFREIADIVRTVYDKENNICQGKIQTFYQQYNGVGDELRENLLTIIDQSFQLKTFEVSSICKEPPLIPDQQINRFKSVLQKTKTFYKSVMDGIDELKQKTLEKGKLINGGNRSDVKGLAQRREASTKKYEKFLSDTCYQNDDETKKSSLIKILDTLSK